MSTLSAQDFMDGVIGHLSQAGYRVHHSYADDRTDQWHWTLSRNGWGEPEVGDYEQSEAHAWRMAADHLMYEGERQLDSVDAHAALVNKCALLEASLAKADALRDELLALVAESSSLMLLGTGKRVEHVTRCQEALRKAKP